MMSLSAKNRNSLILAAVASALWAMASAAQDYVYIVGTNELTYNASITYDLEETVIAGGVSNAVYGNPYAMTNGEIVGWYNDPELGQAINDFGLDSLEQGVNDYHVMVDEVNAFETDWNMPQLRPDADDSFYLHSETAPILDVLQVDKWESMKDKQAIETISLAVEDGQEIQLGIRDIDAVPDSSDLFPVRRRQARRTLENFDMADEVNGLVGRIFSGFDAICENIKPLAVWWRLLLRAGMSALILRKLWVITRQVGLEVVHSVADALAGRNVGTYNYSTDSRTPIDGVD